jgi:hypothetical protein
MSTAPNRRWFRFSLRSLFVVVTAIGSGLGVMIYAGSALRRSRDAFVERHSEARPLIESVYRHYSDTGTWPTNEDIAGHSVAPADWVYSARTDPSDPQSPPMLALHGPYHTSLAYYFEPPKNGTISRRWKFSWEGDKTVFEAQQHYSLDLNSPYQPSLVE